MASSVAALAGTAGAPRSDPARMASRIASKMMSELDANQDGKVSRDEFVAGLKSNGVSVDAANKMFEAIDVQKAGAITKADITSALKQGTIQPPPPPRAGADASRPPRPAPAQTAAARQAPQSASSNFAAQDANQDGTVTAQEATLYRIQHPAEPAPAMADPAQLGQNVDETV